MSPRAIAVYRAIYHFLWKKRTLYVLLGMLIAVGFFVLILATTLQVYLPGYLDVEKRALVMESAARIDSLEHENQLRMAYLNNVMAILKDNVKPQEVLPYDSSVIRIQDTLLMATPREQEFVRRYEAQERFGLQALDDLKPGTPTIVFLAPVRGTVKYLESDDDFAPARVVLTGRVPVLAPADGTIIGVEWLMGEGYAMIIQHGLEYISVLSRLRSVVVTIGQTVKSGEVLGYAGDQENDDYNWIGVQLWRKGKIIDPETMMPF